MTKPFRAGLSTVLAISAFACGHPSTAVTTAEECTGYSDWTSSAYVLPYPAGATYTVIQGNCAPAGDGHRGVNKYSYDFGMAIGTLFTAARGGTVVEVEQSHFDGEVAATGFDNYVVVKHDDGTAALYGHLTHAGAMVAVGATVRQGDPLGRSGNTGNTANIPHLHFSLQACDPVTGGSAACPTLATTFRNTDPNPSGLIVGRSYTAR